MTAAFLAAVLLHTCISALPLYKTPGAPVNARVDDLVKRMNMDEKVAQLVLPFGAKYPADYSGFNKTGLGATYPLSPLPGEEWWETRNNWQRWQVENTRLGIPTSFIAETLHSGYDRGTNFPMPCLQGSTWNPGLVQSVAGVIALEASVSGIDRGFSPVLHFCTDPRFGRCEEAFGEDPHLLSTMGAAAVTGLSGPGGPGAAATYIADPAAKIATEAKHYAAYGFGGRDGGMPAEISENTLYDVYLRPWYKYAQAGGRAVMMAHNEVNGMPCHANAELNHALRHTFGFGDGLCASDAGDVSSVQGYRVAADALHAGALALNAGTDQELQNHGAFTLLPQALQAGLVNMSAIDRAVGNVLRQKVAAGLFDGRPELLYVDPAKQRAALDTPAHRALAREVAEEGVTLLRNEGARLPLRGLGTTLKRVAVVGPNADNAHSTLGLYGYTPGHEGTVTVLAGVVAAANSSGNAFEVVHERGSCLGGTPGCPCSGGAVSGMPPPGPVGDYNMPCSVTDTSRVAAAAAVAAAADVTLLVIGDMSTVSTDPGVKPYYREVATVGEHFDRDDLDPAGAQLPLLRAVVAATPNVVVVLIHGRPVTFGAGASDGYNALFARAPAVLAAWHPGEEAGHAVWRILNGTVNPSGRTAHTWPRTVGQVHQYVPHFLEQHTRPVTNAYADFAPATPLIPFGFGLSYSNYTFANAALVSPNPSCTHHHCVVGRNDTFDVQLDITNTGPMDGKVVVQVYFSQNLASRVRFAKMLLGFAKVAVGAGQTAAAARVPLQVRDVEMWDRRTAGYVVEPGNYTIMVGQYVSDPAMVAHTLTVV